MQKQTTIETYLALKQSVDIEDSFKVSLKKITRSIKLITQRC